MACLAIVQQEQGHVSAESEKLVAQYPRHAADRGARGHHVLQHVQPAAARKVQVQRLHPTCRASCATGRAHSNTCATGSASKRGGTTADGLFTVQKSECLGACADAPVMLVNDRQMVSFMNEQRLDELVATLKAHA